MSTYVSSGSDILSRKMSSAVSETDSGVDVEHDDDNLENNNIEKKVITPDSDVIGRLCNFDEEEEGEMSSDDDSAKTSNSNSPPPPQQICNEDTLQLSFFELKHILSALISENIEESGVANIVMIGRHCPVCRKSIFSMFLNTSAKCEVCSYNVCSQCCTMIEHELSPDQMYEIPSSFLVPSVVSNLCNQYSGKISSLNAANLLSDYQDSSTSTNVDWIVNAVRRKSVIQVTKTNICLVCKFYLEVGEVK